MPAASPIAVSRAPVAQHHPGDFAALRPERHPHPDLLLRDETTDAA